MRSGLEKGRQVKDIKSSEQIMFEHGQAFGVNTEKEGWYGKEMNVQSSPIIDPGTGKTLTIRVFEFSRNPTWKGTLPAKQDIFNMHWRQIRNILWGDGLVAIQEKEFQPRIEYKGDKYYIFLTCEPRMSTFFADKARPLHEYLKK
jgi:hypothetical protein